MRRAALFVAAGFIAGAVLAGQFAGAGTAKPTFDVVGGSDTWQTIAQRNGITADQLQVANNAAASTSNTAHPLTGRYLFIPEVSAPTSSTSSSSTSAPATTTTSTTSTSTSTTAAPSTTPPTTAPPAGALTIPFDSTADLAAFSSAFWRQQWDEPSGGQALPRFPSSVTVSGGKLVITCGMQNYGDCVARLNRPWTGSVLEFDVTSQNTADGWATLTVSDVPYSATSFNGAPQNFTSGPYPANGFELDMTCGQWSYAFLNGTQTYTSQSGCSRGGTAHIRIERAGNTVTVKRGGATVGTFQAGPSQWVSLGSHNHATDKYGSGPTVTSSFDNLSLDAVGQPTECRVLGNVGLFSGSDVSASSRVVVNGRAVPFPTFPGGYKPITYSISEVVPCDQTSASLTVTGVANADKVSIGNVQRFGSSTSPPPTTSVPPSSSTSTTAPAATTTTSPSVSTSSPTTSSSTSTTQPAPSTTQPSSGAAFSEDFRDPSAFSSRFDRGWSGELHAGSAWGDDANDWQADHDMSCGDPMTTSRTIHLPDGESAAARAAAASVAAYQCTPGGDPAKAHLMTSANTEGYIALWFSPRQVFRNVQSVCWSQNVTDLGGGKWTIVNFLTPAEYQGQTDLGYTSPDFPSGGPSTPQGEARNGVKVFRGRMVSYTDGVMRDGPSSGTTSDKAARYQHCVVDNGNGTLTLTVVRPAGGVASATLPGAIPDGDIRVEFADDNYNPDKHFSTDFTQPRDGSGLYTWHWDDITIS